MRIREKDKWKIAFQTQYDHFEYQVIPFGLSNAPTNFQGYVNKILFEKLDIFVIIYLDDIFIYTKNLGQAHIDVVCWILEQLQKHSFYTNLKKYCFYSNEMRFLRYVISAQGVRIKDKKIKVAKNWPKPRSICNIQVFIGFTNFY